MTIASPNVVRRGVRIAGAQAPLEHRALERPAEGGHRRQHDDERDERAPARPVADEERREGAEDREVAVGEVDDPHDAEHQREPAAISA